MFIDEKNMSPEEKKKYLEELRKQLDPEILKKMAGHMGGGDTSAALAAMSDGNIPETSEKTSSSGSSISKFSTPSDRMKERRAMQFQERVAQRKREMELQETPSASKDEPAVNMKALIYSSTEIWTRIVDNQLKNLGFLETKCFYEFQSLIRFLIDCYNNNRLEEIIVAVALKDTTGFVHSWNKLTKEQDTENKLSFLKAVPFIIIVESNKQIPDNRWNIINQDHIISLTDDFDMNQEKVQRLIASAKENNQ